MPYSSEECEQIINICAQYDPLLVRAQTIQSNIINRLAENDGVAVTYESLVDMRKWLDDYMKLGVRLKAFNDKETMN